MSFRTVWQLFCWICVCVLGCEWVIAADIQAGARKRPKLQRLPCAEPPALRRCLLFSAARGRSLTALKWSSLLFHTLTHTHNSSSHFNSAAIDSPYFCTHTGDWRTCMQTCTETYILPLPPSYSLPFCSPICSASLSFFLSPRWLAVRMVNPSWISGGYHHGDRALPHMSIDPPAG